MAILGVDVGGTFTDFFGNTDDGSTVIYKRPSTPGDPARAILEGLDEIAAAHGFRPAELVHGSTVATNAIIERTGARTALITTRGFGDTLLIGRQTRPSLYDLQPRRPPTLVPDALRFEVSERLDHTGAVIQPLDPDEIESLLDAVETAGVESLAVCFLFSFLNPEHERLVADAARKRKMSVSVSHEILPEHREYERTSTTVANAYVAPVMSRYLTRLRKGLSKRGINLLRIMASNAGSIGSLTAGRLAVRTAVSGPAGGVAGAFAIASSAGYGHVITLDMGGTSTDVSLCPGRIVERDETSVGELPIRGPSVDVLSVGAGGGSIARLDEGGALRVGPESAGADPGPACYGTGRVPTVTDAHVVLGRIAPEHFLGGRMSIDTARSLEALQTIAGPFAGDPHRAALAVLRVANAGMEAALRRVSVERGHDPRAFSLVAFGGAGVLHACDLAASLRIPRVLVPPHPGVLSALGMAAAPIVKDLMAAVMLVVTRETAQTEVPLAELVTILAALRRDAERELRSEGLSGQSSTSQTFLHMRYVGQSYELSIPVESLAPGEFLPLFHAAHHERYGHSDLSRPVEVVTARLKLTLPSPTTTSMPVGGARASAQPVPSRQAKPLVHREVWFGDRSFETPIYERSDLSQGCHLSGPAIVVQMDATTAIPPGWRVDVDGMGNLILEPR